MHRSQWWLLQKNVNHIWPFSRSKLLSRFCWQILNCQSILFVDLPISNLVNPKSQHSFGKNYFLEMQFSSPHVQTISQCQSKLVIWRIKIKRGEKMKMIINMKGFIFVQFGQTPSMTNQLWVKGEMYRVESNRWRLQCNQK